LPGAGWRYIAVPLKKNDYCCSFVGADGRRGGSRWQLEIDHVRPYAAGGDNSADNLRVLCRKHNQYAAEEYFGRDVMEQYKRKVKK
jgi:5-methylcytosine-specific restriction endonuclease McrA